jgi:solute carrier family 25 (mitochondrial folate transporter), member 32
MASVTAGACSTLITNPIWVIKTRLMSQVGMHAPAEARPPWHYTGTLDAAVKMYRSEGLKVFYSGLGPALIGLSHVAIQFPLYEFLKERFTGLAMGENHVTDEKHQNYFLGISAATFLSKLTATCATYPHEVLRTRLQTQQRSVTPHHAHEGIAFRGGLGHGTLTGGAGTASSDGMINIPRYRGMVRTIKTMLAEEGWRAFYNGMGTNLLRAVPAAMTTMLTYETLKTVVHRLQLEGGKGAEDEL